MAVNHSGRLTHRPQFAQTAPIKHLTATSITITTTTTARSKLQNTQKPLGRAKGEVNAPPQAPTCPAPKMAVKVANVACLGQQFAFEQLTAHLQWNKRHEKGRLRDKKILRNEATT